MQATTNLSDKIFWHKFDAFYEKFIPKEAKSILEIGVFKGDSIRYWREKYANAQIYGLDIIDPLPEWPQDENIHYFQLDQSDAKRYREILAKIGQPINLLIEDGSHDPLHQKISLMESINALAPGALYILEDLHTSHPSHAYYKARVKEFYNLGTGFRFFGKEKDRDLFTSLQCLLLIEHCKTNHIQIETIKDKIDFTQSLFTYDEVALLSNKIKKINIFKRTVLPNYCYACKTDNFDFITLKCSCGAKLYEESDSMTAVLEF